LRRRYLTPLIALVLPLLLPAVTWAAASTSGTEKPAGHDWTLDSIFVVALGIPLILTILTLVDIAVGKHTSKHE
jgi:hypothetical protein